MNNITRLNVTSRYADATVFNGLVHAAEVPSRPDADMQTQCQSMLEQLEQTLLKAGSDKSCILMATLYIVDMKDYAELNTVWERWLPTGCAPARACIQVVQLANPGYRVEIAVTAAQKP